METIQEEVNEQKSSVEEESMPIQATSTTAKHHKTYSELNRMILEKENFINRLIRENNFLKEELEDGKLLMMSISEEARPNQIIPTLEKPSLNTIEEQAFKIRNLETGQEMEIKESNINKFKKQLLNIKEEEEQDPWYENQQQQRQDLQQQLFKAVEEGNTEVIQHLLDRSIYGELTPCVNYKGPDNHTALHIAANIENEQIIAALLDFGQDCDIQAQTSSTLKTPLHIATSRGWSGVVRLLVRAGADINIKDIEGNTPLHIACQLGHLEIIKFLLTRKNIKIDQKNILGKAPQQMAKDLKVQNLFKAEKQTPQEMIHKPVQIPLQKIQIHSSKQESIQQLLFSPKEQQKQQIIAKQQQLSQQSKQIANNQVQQIVKKQQKEQNIQNLEFESKLSHHSSEDETSANSSTSEKIGPQHFEIKGQLGKGSFGEV